MNPGIGTKVLSGTDKADESSVVKPWMGLYEQ